MEGEIEGGRKGDSDRERDSYKRETVIDGDREIETSTERHTHSGEGRDTHSIYNQFESL